MRIEPQWTGEEEIPFAEFEVGNRESLSVFDFEAWRIVKPAMKWR